MGVGVEVSMWELAWGPQNSTSSLLGAQLPHQLQLVQPHHSPSSCSGDGKHLLASQPSLADPGYTLTLAQADITPAATPSGSQVCTG